MLTTFNHIAALIVAMHRNDVDATARLLDELEASLEPETLADILEAILGEEPARVSEIPPLAPAPVRCA